MASAGKKVVRESEVDMDSYRWRLDIKGGSFTDWTDMMHATDTTKNQLTDAEKRMKAADYETRVVDKTKL